MLHFVSDKKYQELIKKEAELNELEKRLIKLNKDVNELVYEAKSYLKSFGITDEDLERIKTKNRFSIVE